MYLATLPRQTALANRLARAGYSVGATQSNDHLVFAGSQFGGGNPTGQFGSLDLTQFGAPNNAIPSGVTVMVDGVVLTVYDTIHGVEPGYVEAARELGLTTNMRMLCRYVDATTALDWINTNWATVLTDAASFSGSTFNPCVVHYAMGGQDLLSAATLGAAKANWRRLINLIRATYPNALIVFTGLMATDLATYTQQTAGRAYGKELLGQPHSRFTVYVSPATWEPFLVSDSTHLTSTGICRLGMGLHSVPYSRNLIRTS